MTAGNSLYNKTRMWLLAAVALLLAVFAFVALTANSTKSPTYDEPYHLAAAWTGYWKSDLRFDSEDPPLWKYFIALAIPPNAFSPKYVDKPWPVLPAEPIPEFKALLATVYEQPPVEIGPLFQRCHVLMVMFGLAIGAMIAAWCWRLCTADDSSNAASVAQQIPFASGAIGTIAAVAFFAFDPNFLAHSPLVKNDVVCALSFFASAIVVWSAGRKLTWMSPILIGLMLGISLTVKFSGVLNVVAVGLLLFARAVLPAHWPVFGRTVRSRGARVVAASLALCTAGLIAWGFIWAVYQFRYAPSNHSDWQLNIHNVVDQAKATRWTISHPGRQILAAEVENLPAGFIVNCMKYLDRAQLLPQAWTSGFLFTYTASLMRPSYLLGEHRETGWWWYFPFAMLVKTPVCTTLAFIAAAITLIVTACRRAFHSPGRVWSLACLVLTPLLYLTAAMSSNLNLGIRHVLVVYPFAYVGVGLAAACCWRKLPRAAFCAAAIIVLTGAASETLLAYPHYLAYFNLPAGGRIGGYKLLTDSNLDWGQDLPLLANWQKDHPDRKLYFCYFGTADPAHYGIRYVNLPGGYMNGPTPELPREPGVIAISATDLQSGDIMPADSGYERMYRDLRQLPPIAILGGSIYLYDFPPKDMSRFKHRPPETTKPSPAH